MLRGMLLDIDGTLLLSNDAHASAWVEAYGELGYDILFAKVRPLIGMGGDKVMTQLTPDLDESSGVGKEIARRRREIFLNKYLPTVDPAPGARELVLRLTHEGLTLTVATSAKREELGALLKAACVDDLIHHETTSDDAENSKPDPDIIRAAIDRSEVKPEEVYMLGDTPYDVESARRGGVGIVAVRCGGHSDDALRGALGIYDDPADILANFDDSPIGKRLGDAVQVS